MSDIPGLGEMNDETREQVRRNLEQLRKSINDSLFNDSLFNASDVTQAGIRVSEAGEHLSDAMGYYARHFDQHLKNIRNENHIKKDLHIQQTLMYSEFANMVRGLLTDEGIDCCDLPEKHHSDYEYEYTLTERITFVGDVMQLRYYGFDGHWDIIPLPKDLDQFLSTDRWWPVIINWIKMMIWFDDNRGE